MDEAFFQDMDEIRQLLPQRLRTFRSLALLLGLDRKGMVDFVGRAGALEGWTGLVHEGEWEPLPRSGPGYVETPLVEALRFFRGGRVLDGAEVLIRWTGCLSRPDHIWVIELCLRCTLRRLACVSFARSGIREMERYMELCLSLQPVAAFYAVEPEQMQRVILRARVAARRIGDGQAFRLLNTVFETQSLLDPRGYPYCYLSDPEEKGTGLVGLVEDRVYNANTALFFGTYHLLMGHPRLALDHFVLRSSAVSEEAYQELVEAIYAPFEAVASAMTGEFHRARALLLQELQTPRRFRHSAVRCMLQIRLAEVLLDMGETESALEYIDAAMDGVSLGGHIPGWIAAHVSLARCHLLSGRVRQAWNTLEKALPAARTMGYEYVTCTPAFLNMLYMFRRKGFPDIPYYGFDNFLRRCLKGSNLTMRYVALRIRAHQMLNGGRPIEHTYPLLRKCRNFFAIYGLAHEEAKTNAMLADACLKSGDRKFALRYAIEAWPFYARYPALSASWPETLRDLIPHAPVERQRIAGQAESCLRQLTRALLELDPLDQQFLSALTAALCRVFGASRGIIWRVSINGGLRLLHLHGVARDQVEGNVFSTRRRLIEESCGVIPFHTMVRTEENAAESGLEAMALVLPVPQGLDSCHTFYFEGLHWLWSEENLTESVLVQLGEMLAVLLRRWSRRLEQGSTGRNELPKEDGLLHQSEVMRDFLQKVDSAATADVSVLIHGESGVGKELIARRIHRMSRRPGPFVAVNLSSLPEELFESEMQGHERGAFTGANQQKIGLLELAHRGTLFIDEVPDISPRVQVKLLRLLQERSFMRLGSTRVIHSDFRLVVATNKDLKEEVRQGRFRSDLFYRICVISLHVPPLRERREDIPLIAAHYLEEFAGRHHRDIPVLGKKHWEKLCTHTWPGNVRELRNVMEQAVILSSVDSPYLAMELSDESPEESAGPAPRLEIALSPFQPVAFPSFMEFMEGALAAFPSLDKLEEFYIREVLRVTKGRVSGRWGAATLLGMSRGSLYEKMRRLGIEHAASERKVETSS